MSRQNSALASLTANYTDSEDDDLSPDPATVEIENKDEDSDGVGSGGSGNLVSYNLEHDQIDDQAIDDHFVPPIETLDEMEQEMSGPGSGIQSPDNFMDTETVSSEDEFSSPSSAAKKARLPAEPTGKCSAELQDKFTKMIKSKQAGKLNMNEIIQTKKMFRNPSIYEKLISHLNIDEFGTNYAEDVYNPHDFPASSYYDELAKIQKSEMDRREKERRDRTKVEFVSGTVKKPTIPTTTVVNIPGTQSQSQAQTQAQAESDSRRKSKWDQRGVMPPIVGLIPMSAPSQPVVIPPSIVTSVAAANKAKTVINAFGNLPKKSK